MIIKEKDDIEPAVLELNRLLSLPSLSKNQKESIEDEIALIRAGARGEREAAYHINFELGETRNWAIIHDLRIEHKGRVAQIDHVLMNRFLDIFLIESKNFSTSIRINGDEEFQVKTRYGWRGMQSPVEQNKRHEDVLSSLVSDGGLLPKRLGFQLSPVFHRWVLVSPECNVTGRKAAHDIIKMDMFGSRMKKFRNEELTLIEMAKMISAETLADFARKLVAFHKPISFDYAGKFGISPADKFAPPPLPAPVQHKDRVPCENCGASLDSKTINFCRLNKKRFDGKMLCQKCQGYVPADVPAPVPAKPTGNACAECGTPVDSKVVAFCRFNSSKFGKRILCRTCQATVAK